MERLAAQSSRRATQLSVQRLLCTAPRSAARLPPVVPSDLVAVTGTVQMPAWIGLAAPTTAASPSCVCCGCGLSWADWRDAAVWLPLGDGSFASSCEACRARDALFKDGRAD